MSEKNVSLTYIYQILHAYWEPSSTYLVFTLKIDHLQWFSNLTAKLCCQLIMCEIDNKKSYND